MPRQAIRLRFIHQQVERVQSTQNALVGPIQLGFGLPSGLEVRDTLLSPFFQILDRPELNRCRRADRRTGGLQAVLQPVIAQRALLRRALSGVLRAPHVDDTKRTRRHAGTAAVARRLLDVHAIELGANNRPSRADLQTGRIDAVLAHIRHHQPAQVTAVRTSALLDELNVAPVHVGERPGVIIGIPGNRQ